MNACLNVPSVIDRSMRNHLEAGNVSAENWFPLASRSTLMKIVKLAL